MHYTSNYTTYTNMSMITKLIKERERERDTHSKGRGSALCGFAGEVEGSSEIAGERGSGQQGLLRPAGCAGAELRQGAGLPGVHASGEEAPWAGCCAAGLASQNRACAAAGLLSGCGAQ